MTRAPMRTKLTSRYCATAITLLCMVALGRPAAAQHSGDFGLTYTQERSKFAGNYCQCFTLRGATADFSTALFHGVGPVVSAQGLAVSNLQGSIDIHQITFMVGPRYTYNIGRIDPVLDNRRAGIFIEGKVGYTFATAGTVSSQRHAHRPRIRPDLPGRRRDQLEHLSPLRSAHHRSRLRAHATAQRRHQPAGRRTPRCRHQHTHRALAIPSH